jgi:uncharacterized RDD family membrane protein YckC
MQLAKIWKRIVGGIIDLTIITALSTLAVAVFVYLNENSNYFLNASYEMKELAIKIKAFEFAVAIDLIYTIGMHLSAAQATYGQRLFNIKIANERGGKANLIQVIVRYLISWVSSLMLKIGYLFALSPNKQTLHDLIAKTVVIENEDKQIHLEKINASKKIIPITIGVFLLIATLISVYRLKIDSNEKTFELIGCKRCNGNSCAPEIRFTKLRVTLENIERYYILDGVENKLVRPSKNTEKCEVIKSKNFAFTCSGYKNDVDRFFNNTYTSTTVFDGVNQYQETSTTESNLNKWTSTVVCAVK